MNCKKSISLLLAIVMLLSLTLFSVEGAGHIGTIKCADVSFGDIKNDGYQWDADTKTLYLSGFTMNGGTLRAEDTTPYNGIEILCDDATIYLNNNVAGKSKSVIDPCQTYWGNIGERLVFFGANAIYAKGNLTITGDKGAELYVTGRHADGIKVGGSLTVTGDIVLDVKREVRFDSYYDIDEFSAIYAERDIAIDGAVVNAYYGDEYDEMRGYLRCKGSIMLTDAEIRYPYYGAISYMNGYTTLTDTIKGDVDDEDYYASEDDIVFESMGAIIAPAVKIATFTESLNIEKGTTGTLSVVVEETSLDLKYEWFKLNDSEVWRQVGKGAAYTIETTDTTKQEKNYYRCVVTNEKYGSWDATPAITVAVVGTNLIKSPVINSLEATVNGSEAYDTVYAEAGDSVELKVDATSPDGAPLSYNWWSPEYSANGAAKGLSTTASYTVPTSKEGYYIYYCTVGASGKNNTERISKPVIVIVGDASEPSEFLAAPTITSAETNEQIEVNDVVNMYCDAELRSDGALKYQWYNYKNGRWNEINGATSNDYFCAIDTEGTYFYACKVTAVLNKVELSAMTGAWTVEVGEGLCSNHYTREAVRFIEPTCIIEGQEVGTCINCHGVECEPIEARPHTFSSWATKVQATATEFGQKERYCTGCGFTEIRRIDRSGETPNAPEAKLCTDSHNMGEWVADVDNASLKIRQCTRCDFKEGMADTYVFPFVDVPEAAWYYNDVLLANKLGIINGKSSTTFCPDDNMTIAEAITIAVSIHQNLNGTDVKIPSSNPWYQGYVDYARKNKVIKQGYDDYNQLATRAEYVRIFSGALPNGYLTDINDVPAGAIPDVASADKYADEIYTFYRAGILTGSDEAGSFNPDSNIKRSEVAAIITRIMDSDARVKK